ncbi:hypothetical protein [Streptococcus pluranimalium]|uniref:hypothetical protein n=1 Tax=Streptococcus pluranimalium TaxID=82348 RepID=UPI003F6742E3
MTVSVDEVTLSDETDGASIATVASFVESFSVLESLVVNVVTIAAFTLSSRILVESTNTFGRLLISSNVEISVFSDVIFFSEVSLTITPDTELDKSNDAEDCLESSLKEFMTEFSDNIPGCDNFSDELEL